MKKLRTQYIILAIISTYFLLNGCIPREVETNQTEPISVVQYGFLKFNHWRAYADYLELEEGYSTEASEKIAKVQFDLIRADEDYKALMED